MTTDDRVMAILERANPVPSGELVDVPIGATRYLETAMEQRSEPMTVIDPTPTHRPDRPPRRRWPVIAVAASVVAIVVASIALIVATRDDAAVVDQPETTVPPTVPATAPEAVEPAPTTAAGPDTASARAVVDEFFAAYNAGDTDAVMALFANGASATGQYGGALEPEPSDEPSVRSELENALAWNHAQGESLTTPACNLAEEQPDEGTGLLCTYQTLDAVVKAADGEPIPTTTLFVVGDGVVTGMHALYTGVDFATLGQPFNAWMDSYHPEIRGTGCCEGDTRMESEQRGAQRAEWAQEWARWRDAWECTTALCYLAPTAWVAEYDARCPALDPSARPNAQFVDEIRFAEEELLEPDLTDERIAELQQARLDAMVELGIDPACHPTVG